MTTTFYTGVTLDGFIASPEHSLDWLTSRDIDQAGPFGYEPFIVGIGALVMGRSTFDWVERERATTGAAWFYDVPTWVMTNRPVDLPDGADVRAAAGDVAAVHAAMTEAAAGRDLWIVGGGGLAADFARAGLLDEVVVAIAPVTLGAGAPLLPAEVELRLEDTGRNGDFVCARYSVVRPA